MDRKLSPQKTKKNKKEPIFRSGDVSVMDENSLTPALGVFSLISLAFLCQFNLWGSLQDDKMPIFGYI